MKLVKKVITVTAHIAINACVTYAALSIGVYILSLEARIIKLEQEVGKIKTASEG